MHESSTISNNSRLHLFTHNEMLSACMYVSKLERDLVNVIFTSTCVGIKLDSVAHFLVYQIFNYVRFCAPQA